MARRWVEGAAEPTRLRRPLLHPSRWPVAVGLAMVARGIFGPWQTVSYPVGPPQVTTGVSGADAPGLQILILAAATALVCALPIVAGSRTRTVQLLPVLAGAATLLVAVQAYRVVTPKGTWDPGGGSGVVVEWGMWVVFAGSALIALGGLATTLIIAHDRPLVPEPGEPKADFSFVPPLIAALVGFGLAVAGVEFVVPLLPPEDQVAATPLLFIGAVAATLVVYGAMGRIREAAAAQRSRTSTRAGHDMPELEPLRRKDRR